MNYFKPLTLMLIIYLIQRQIDWRRINNYIINNSRAASLSQNHELPKNIKFWRNKGKGALCQKINLKSERVVQYQTERPDRNDCFYSPCRIIQRHVIPTRDGISVIFYMDTSFPAGLFITEFKSIIFISWRYTGNSIRY